MASAPLCMLRADVYLRLPTPHPSPLPRTGRMADDAARRPTLVGRRPAAAGGRGEAHAETGKAHRLRKGQVQGIARYAYLLARRLLARAVRSFPRCTQTRSHVHGLMDLVVLEGLVGLSFPFYLCSPMYQAIWRHASLRRLSTCMFRCPFEYHCIFIRTGDHVPHAARMRDHRGCHQVCV